MESSIDFGDLLARDVPLEWHEAVAVVQEACGQLFGPGVEAPDPTHIRLHPAGTIELLPQPHSSEPPTQRLGHTLNALMQGTLPPAELRLFASESTSVVAAAISVDDFSRRLAYFERPGRSRVLQLLYERAAPALAAAPPRREHPDTQAPVAVASDAENADANDGALRNVRARVAVFAALMGCALTFWGWYWLRANHRTPPVPAVLSETRAVVGSLIAGTVSSGKALLGSAGLIDVPKTAATPDPDIPGDVKIRPARDNKTPASRSSSTSSVPSPPVVAPETREQPAGSVSPPARAATPDEVSADATVYTANAPGVLPPKLVWPQLPTTAPTDGADPPRPSPGEVDLLVNEGGVVEAVKLLTAPGGFHQRMLLSAMKAWRYHPAVKDGRPVRYVVRVTIPFY
jgi:hypothetical protein